MADSEASRRFYSVLWPHMATVLRTATFLTHATADAEDLAQETMLKAFSAIDQLHDDAGARPWLLTILRRTHIDRIRAGKHREESLDGLDVDLADPVEWSPQEATDVWSDPESALNGFSDQEMIDALRALPREIRWTLLLVDVEGLDQQEAAQILNVPAGTIKSRCHRGRAMLRTRLEKPKAPTHMDALNKEQSPPASRRLCV